MPDLDPPVSPPVSPPAPPPEPPPPPAPPAKALYLSTADVFGRLAGAVWSLTAEQAAEGGNALTLIPEGNLTFALAAWGRAPLVRD